MLNIMNIELKTDIKNDRPTALGIKLMSQDKNNNQFILRFTNGGEPVNLDDTYTVEILTKFSNSGASRLTSAIVRQDYATWQFDTDYITQDERVDNYVYVRKAGNLVVSADANAFYFEVGLSEIDKNAGRVAEVYDENYQKYLDEFKDNVDFEEIAQAEQARKDAEILRQESYEAKVDTAIVEADVVAKVDNKVTELTPQINSLTTQLAHIELSKVDKGGAGQVSWAMADQNFREIALGEKPMPVVGEDSVGKPNIINKSVTLGKVDFIKGANYFDGVFSNLSVANFNTESTTAEIGGTSDDYRSVVIEVDKQETFEVKTNGAHNRFTVVLANSLARYSPVKVLHRDNAPVGQQSIIFNNDEDHKYLVAFLSISKQEPEIFVGLGAELKIGGDTIARKKVDDFDGGYITPKSVGEDKLDFIEYSDNRFFRNDKDILDGVYIDDKGKQVVYPTSSVSGYIPVVPGQVFILPRHSSYLDAMMGEYCAKDKTFVQKLIAVTEGGYRKITVPDVATIKYMRVNFHKSDRSTFMIYLGNTYPAEYQHYFKRMPDGFTLNDSQKADVTSLIGQSEINPLYSKTMIFDGDSLGNGSSAGDGLGGWAGRIMAKNNMAGKNYAVNGATITGGTSAGHQICRNVSTMIAEYPDADYIIIEGGANDTDLLLEDPAKVGTLSLDFTTFDDTTFFGALESTFAQAIAHYSGEKIGFIIAPKMAYQGHGLHNTSRYRLYFDRVIEVCKKWGVSYLDLWYTSHLNPDVTTDMYTDLQHLSSRGYDYTTPIVEAWMKTL